uniref:Holocarboxylase synthetase (biotin-(proprionyl-CoA-carboxylase (ATP-hydrolysing)) ligase) n=1 Tax=Neolamprologus brichardi TaxID=32507 RepID=A0A3Q4GH33_NEOBR
IEDRLQLDNGLTPSKIVPVLLPESTLSALLDQQRPQSPRAQSSLLPCSTGEPIARHHHLQCRKGSFLLIPEVKRRLEDRRGSEPLRSSQDLESLGDLEEHSLGNHHHMEGHGHHLHLSSCHECLELENSTILSVKYASAENIPDLPDDNSVGNECLDELENDSRGFFGQSGGKLPNVLVYTGGCQERFQTVRQLLSECINTESNIIYPLQPEQALNDPWLENTRLLVLAEEETLSPQLQTRFLTYLSQGGKVLGLASSLCPAGLCLEVRQSQCMQVNKLNFTKEDSTELNLSILASGKVYIRDPRGGGEVELWGELKGDVPHKDMVIVRLTHGGDSGEAVLCQVHFEIAPDSQNLPLDAFDELKVNNASRYEVLTEILTSLGLKCEPSQTPSPSAVHLLATSQVRNAAFLCSRLRTASCPIVCFTVCFRCLVKLVLVFCAVGRGRNAWLSPLGCAMFTLNVQIELNSKLGQRIPFLQHLVALAVVEAVCSLPGYQDIDLRVKWPNDIYYGNRMKLGGVLVTSTVLGSTFHLLIGCGFNVTNSNPTVCINDLIQSYNLQHSCSLQPLSCAQLIARTVNCLEALIDNFQQGGPESVLPTYYKRWLHRCVT